MTDLVPALAPEDLADPLTVRTAELVGRTDAVLARYVAFPSDGARLAVALWIMHTHVLDSFESTPRLALLSPEKGSGKTRGLEVVALLAPDPIHTVNVSAAALFRMVATRRPVLLLDEADTYLGGVAAKQHEDLRGLVNAGHRRGAVAYRCDVAGKKVSVEEFPAFAAVALAGIGDLPDTITDRAVVIPMRRRAPTETIEPLRDRLARVITEPLRDDLANWGSAASDRLTGAWPDMPDGIIDRAADVWEPLLAIADLAGDAWSDRARQGAVELNAARAAKDPSLGVQLLGDCRRIFASLDVDRLSTDALLEALNRLDESPWGDLRGKALDARGLARRLRKYDVRPGDHRFTEGTRKGYLDADFHDAWARYLPVADVAHVALAGPQRGDEPSEGTTPLPGTVAPVAFEGRGVGLSIDHTETHLSPPTGKGNKGNTGDDTPDICPDCGDVMDANVLGVHRTLAHPNREVA